MNKHEQHHYNTLYHQHIINLRLQGKRPATIDAYSRAVRRITLYFDRCPDTLSIDDLKQFFHALIQTHSWSTVKLDRNGLQFFYKYTLDKQWQWLNIVKPPQSKIIPDILTPLQVAQLISHTKQHRYQVFFLVLYSMGLRLSEALHLCVQDIDSQSMQIHVRSGKGGKDRMLPLPQQTLLSLRQYWATHRHPTLIFPGFGKTDNPYMDKGGIQKALKAVLVECAINKRISPHSLRHCFATHLLEQGLDLRSLQQLLGHNSLNTTARYTQLTPIKQQQSAAHINLLTEHVVQLWRDSL